MRGAAFQTILPLDMQRLKLVINFQTSPPGAIIEVINFEQTDALRLLTLFCDQGRGPAEGLRLGWGHTAVVVL